MSSEISETLEGPPERDLFEGLGIELLSREKRGKTAPMHRIHRLWGITGMPVPGPIRYSSTTEGGILSYAGAPVYRIHRISRDHRFLPLSRDSLKTILRAVFYHPEGALLSPFELTPREVDTAAAKVLGILDLDQSPRNVSRLLSPPPFSPPYSRRPLDVAQVIVRNRMAGAASARSRSILTRELCTWACARAGLLPPLPSPSSLGWDTIFLDWEDWGGPWTVSKAQEYLAACEEGPDRATVFVKGASTGISEKVEIVKPKETKIIKFGYPDEKGNWGDSVGKWTNGVWKESK